MLVDYVKAYLAKYPVNDNRFKLIAIIASICIIFDQLTKYYIMSTFRMYETIAIIPNFFNLTYVRNYGAAFGFLNDPTIDWQFWFFAVFTIIAIGFLILLTKTSSYDRNLFVAYALILGGAIGNFIDRILFRSVTDFLHFYIGEWHWPAFNIADIVIVVGTFIAIFLMYTEKEENEN